MKNFYLGNVAIVLFSFFAASSGSFASTRDDTGFSKNNAHRLGETPETTLPLFSDLATPSKCDMNDKAVVSAEFVEPFSDNYIIDPDEPEVATLNWLENEMQMSIDPTNAPQQVTAGWSCTRPPFNCPNYQRCPLADGTSSICTVNECGEGKCSFCPVNPPFRIVNSWCTYTCKKGPAVVGSAFGFRLAGDLWFGPTCL